MRRNELPVTQLLWAAVALLVLLAAAGLVFGPGRGMRTDIDRQRELVAQQLEVTRRQLEITREQRQISKESLEVARSQLELARALLARTDTSLEYQRQLLRIAEATLKQAEEINRKTPDANPAR